MIRRVIMDRTLDEPIRLDDVATMDQQTAWCTEQYRVRHVTSLLGLDGRRLVCSFEAPDAEAVRDAARQLGAQTERIWPCTVEGPLDESALAATVKQAICVERSFTDPVDLAALDAQEKASGWCLEQHGVRFLLTFFALDRHRMLCLYAAPDADAVRYAQSKAKMPFDQVWAAQLYVTP